MMNNDELKIYNLVRAELNEGNRPKAYKDGKVDSPYYGHCHTATIAMYYLLGDKKKGYKVKKAIDEKEIMHYWLVTSNEEIIDPTKEQYTDLHRDLPYGSVSNDRVSYRKTNATKEIIEKVKKKLSNTNVD
jgi:hypothetical protein